MTSFHSERVGGDLHLGKKPARPVRSDTPRFRDLVAGLSLPKPPVPFGHGKDFGNGPPPGWGMFGNGPSDDGSIPDMWAAINGAGDCFFAGEYHRLKESASNAGRPVPPISGRRVIETYAERTGYNPVSGEGDEGSDPQEQLATMQRAGLQDDNHARYLIGQVVALTPGDLTELWQATWLFENTGIGIVVTEAQQQQFEEQKPWDHVPGSPEVGGHYVIPVGRPDKSHGALISWAERVLFTGSFYQQQNDETYCYLDPERYNRVTKHTAEHFSEQDLEKFIAMLARR